jgi:type IV pilus assembly protein PilC
MKDLWNKLSTINIPGLGSGVKTEEIVIMTRSLASMLDAGLPLSRALSVIERQSGKRPLARIMNDVITRINTGASLHESLGHHTDTFSRLFISMVRAGEESGSLTEALTVVGGQMERAVALTKKVKGAMMYPAVILLAMVIIGILMLTFVVPTLSRTFTQLGVEIPTVTKIILATSDFLAANFILTSAGLVAVVAAIFFGLRTKIGVKFSDHAVTYIPIVGPIIREVITARTARTMSSLLKAGVDVVLALSITREVVGNARYAPVLQAAEGGVTQGKPLSEMLSKNAKLYPPLFLEMIAVGEETGKLAELLSHTAEYFEAEVEQKTKDLSTVIEPLLMLFIGAGVGFFAIAMLAPIYSISDSIK